MARSTARPFTRMALDRASTERKDPERVQQLLRDPDARTLISAEDGVLLRDGDTPGLARVELPGEPGPEPVLLGLDDAGKPLFGIDLEALPADLRSRLVKDARLTPLREAGTVLAHDEAGLAAYLSSLLGWHRRHEFCANCGARTMIEEA